MVNELEKKRFIRALGVYFPLSLIVASVLVVVCYFTVDPYFAMRKGQFAVKARENYPDFLLLWVMVSSLGAWGFYFFQQRFVTWRLFCFYYGWLTPLSFLIKDVLKFTFARPVPADVLSNPSLYGFHWWSWRYVSFPSGHMAVMTTSTLLFIYFYPYFRWLGYLFLLSLGIFLIAGNYHYVSDVIAGTFIGYWIYYLGYLHNPWRGIKGV